MVWGCRATNRAPLFAVGHRRPGAGNPCAQATSGQDRPRTRTPTSIARSTPKNCPVRRRYVFSMRFGYVVPHGDAADVAEMAALAEQTGWDGLFVWEGLYGVDARVSLGAAAVRTDNLRLGTLLTPASRRKPWELASQVATVDRLSKGRVTLSVGLGSLDSGFREFGEECDRKTRAQLMDECLDIMTMLWTGEPVSYDGCHYRIEPSTFPSIKH